MAGALRRVYRRLAQAPAERELRVFVDTLRQVPPFQVFGRAAHVALAEAVHPRTYRRDEFIYYEGDPGLGLYIVRRGRVRLLVEDEQGRAHELRQVGEHEIFGDLSIAGDFRRLASAQAVTEAHVLGFFRPDPRTMVRRRPQVGAEVLGALARHLAARQVEVMHLVAERDGKQAALRMFEGADVRTNAREETLSSAYI